MATYKAPKGISKRAELRKDAATTAFIRSQDFFSKYQRLLTYSGAAVCVLGLGLISFIYINRQRAAQANDYLGVISLYYERGEYRTALDGAGDALGLEDIINEYGGTGPGNMARFYAADAAFRLQEYDNALKWFEDYRGSGDILEASALDGQAAIHELLGDYERAAELYERAADVLDNPLRSPEYLTKAARAYIAIEAYEEAEEVLLKIQEDYPDSEGASDVDFHLGFVRARLR